MHGCLRRMALAASYWLEASSLLGPKMATENQRNFSEEQTRRMRDAQIGLQAGQAGMASQAGHGGMGNTRHM